MIYHIIFEKHHEIHGTGNRMAEMIRLIFYDMLLLNVLLHLDHTVFVGGSCLSDVT